LQVSHEDCQVLSGDGCRVTAPKRTEAPRTLGRMEGAVTRLFTKSAVVSQSRWLSERFHLVTLSGDALRGVRWSPGDKIQVAVGGWAYRTYTPLSWDPAVGHTQLLVFSHGEGPGAAWGKALQVGDSCALFGPRNSVDLDSLERPALLFGDETSFAVSHALRSTSAGLGQVRPVYEVASKKTAQSVLVQLGITDFDLVERTADDSHLEEVERIVLEHVQARSITSCALTGKASSIQRLNKQLRARGLAGKIRTRAYWSPGKQGLD
jgi:NADPH-dependent ferric siderophore reductase